MADSNAGMGAQVGVRKVSDDEVVQEEGFLDSTVVEKFLKYLDR